MINIKKKLLIIGMFLILLSNISFAYSLAEGNPRNISANLSIMSSPRPTLSDIKPIPSTRFPEPLSSNARLVNEAYAKFFENYGSSISCNECKVELDISTLGEPKITIIQKKAKFLIFNVVPRKTIITSIDGIPIKISSNLWNSLFLAGIIK